MKYKKIIFFSLVFIFIGTSVSTDLPYKLISNLTRKTVTTTLSVKFACSTTGSESTLTTTTSSTDATSGVGDWYCRKTDGSWEVCPNSFACTSYNLTGWLGYDKVKVFDKAGNVSSEMDLYTIDSANSSKTDLSSDDLTSGLYAIKVGTNPVHIIDYKANVGEITKAQIKDGRIKLTGKPAKTTITDTTLTSYSASMKKVCNIGKSVCDKDNNCTCVVEDYRVQNATCSCAYKKNNDKYETVAGGCVRPLTYCDDKYASNTANTNEEETFKIITNRENKENGTQKYLRDDKGDGTCYTYYKKDANGNEFDTSFNTRYFLWGGIHHFCAHPYQTYACFQNNLREALGFNSDGTCCKNYDPLPVLPGVKKLMVNASKSKVPPCNIEDKTEVVSHGNGSYSAGYLGDLCDRIATELNKDKDFAKGISTTEENGESWLVVPVISSAPCKFQKSDSIKNAAPNNNSVIGQIENTAYYFYCPDGGKVDADNGYKCSESHVVTKSAYEYNWTVNYYRKK